MTTAEGTGRRIDDVCSAVRCALDQRVARVIRCTGPAGVGKSHSVLEATTTLAAEGWLPIRVSAHRVQKRLSEVVVRRFLTGLVEALGDEHERYTAGIGGLVESAAPVALEKLLGAVLLDRPVLLVLDDAMWADQASIAIFSDIITALSDTALALVFVDRDDELGRSFAYVDEHLLFSPLHLDATRAAARTLLRGASDDVIEAAAASCGGRIGDIVSLVNGGTPPERLTTADVAASLRSRVARDVAQLPAHARDFLQLCALVGEPIRYGLLRRIFPDESALLAAIEAVSETFLVQHGDELSFTHPSVEQAVRETIAIEIPRRRRIIAAIDTIENKSFEDLERLVQQAAACGDTPAQVQYLFQLADAAERLGSLGVTVSALERVLEHVASNPVESNTVRGRLSMAYLAISRGEDAARVIAPVQFDDFTPEQAPLRIALMIQSLFALWHTSERATFERQYDRYTQIARGDAMVLTQLLTVRLFASVCDFDTNTYEALVERLQPALKHPAIAVRVKSFKGMMHARLGDPSAAHREFSEALALAQGPLVAARAMVDMGVSLVTAYDRGPGSAALESTLHAFPATSCERAQLEALGALSHGGAKEALHIATEAFIGTNGQYARRQLLGICAATATLGDCALPPALEATLERELRTFVREPGTTSLLGIASAGAKVFAGSNPMLARAVAQGALEGLRRCVEPMTFTYAPALVRAFEALGERAALKRIADGELASDRSSWSLAQTSLAAHLAARALGRAARGAELRESLLNLDAPFFASMVDATADAQSQPLPTILNPLTRREREVAIYVAQGKSNREIAESFVLSERTIESHVANIFSKLNVSSRAQIAALYAREAVTA